MRVISIFVTLIVLVVGSWVSMRYAGIIRELKSSHGLPQDADQDGPFDQELANLNSWFYEDEGSTPGKTAYVPAEPVSTGVQTNPFGE
ncbi:MAG: hypothetical protein AB8B91_04070 [Rubripirellula sp.]